MAKSEPKSVYIDHPSILQPAGLKDHDNCPPPPCTIFARNAYLRINQRYFPMCQFLSRLVVVAVAILTASCSSEPGSLELSFQYNKQPGPGSNQYAVWIENADGQVVKTLYVTEFTAKGRSRDGSKPARGYTYRPSCTPTWVQHVGAESLTDQQIDAFTGPRLPRAASRPSPGTSPTRTIGPWPRAPIASILRLLTTAPAS